MSAKYFAMFIFMETKIRLEGLKIERNGIGKERVNNGNPQSLQETHMKLASVNSIRSMPSLVYQCRNALRLNMAANWSVKRLNASWMAVLLYRNVAAVFCPVGGTSHTAIFRLFGIHSTKAEEWAFCISQIVSSTSLMASCPRNMAATVRYLPWRGSHATIMFWGPNILFVSSEMP